MKYRIVKERYSSGDVWFVVQKRLFGLLWVACSEQAGYEYYEAQCFGSLSKAELYIENKKNKAKQNKLISVEVLKESK